MKIGNEDWNIRKLVVGLQLTSFLFLSCQSPKQIRNCTTPLSEVSDIRGFKIGMSLDEINKRFQGIDPKLSSKIPEFSSDVDIRSSVVALDSSYSDGTFYASTKIHPELSGVDSVALKFVENKVALVRVKYDETRDVKFDDSFFQKLSESLNLSDDWRIASNEDYERAKAIRCKDYTVTAEVDIVNVDTKKVLSGVASDAITYSPWVKIELTNLEQILRDKEWEKENRKEEKERERERTNSFRP